MEQFLEADIVSVVKNDVSQSGNSMVLENFMVENNLLKEEIERLKHANDMLSKNNDDVCTQFSKENLQLKRTLDLCQAKSIKMELKIHDYKESLKHLEKQIADLKIEVNDWRQNRNDIKYENGLLESDIQDQKHLIIDLKEKIKQLEKRKVC